MILNNTCKKKINIYNKKNLFKEVFSMKINIKIKNLVNTIFKSRESIKTNRLILTRKKAKRGVLGTMWPIFLKENMNEVGWIGVVPDGEIYYQLYEGYKKKGYMTEAMTAFLDSNKEKRFYLSIDESNEDSQKVAEKLGFQKIKKEENDNSSTDIYIKKT